jgi:Asp-tRNA(Asn)/Glu-tRNA(Gln) amidotransferase A subunit family amidase
MSSLVPTFGIVPVEGVVPLARFFDPVGPTAKDILDVANLVTVLIDPSKPTVSISGYSTVLDKSWKTWKISTMDPEIWQYPDFWSSRFLLQQRK